MEKTLFLIFITLILFLILKLSYKSRIKIQKRIPKEWKDILNKHVLFYTKLSDKDKKYFEKRVQLFLAQKKITGVDTDVDLKVKLLVASSAIIPVFAFPDFTYPNVKEILIYPNSFDEKFQTKRYKGHKEFIIGMVGDNFLRGTVILSKPDLLSAFDGNRHKNNVGIHEFVHLLDDLDGNIDGVPTLLLKHSYVGSWLHEIKKEMKRIEKGKSDINPYAIKSNAEFLAVVSEYFFSNPEKFKTKHPQLYNYLSAIFKQ